MHPSFLETVDNGGETELTIRVINDNNLIFSCWLIMCKLQMLLEEDENKLIQCYSMHKIELIEKQVDSLNKHAYSIITQFVIRWHVLYMVASSHK